MLVVYIPSVPFVHAATKKATSLALGVAIAISRGWQLLCAHFMRKEVQMCTCLCHRMHNEESPKTAPHTRTTMECRPQCNLSPSVLSAHADT